MGLVRSGTDLHRARAIWLCVVQLTDISDEGFVSLMNEATGDLKEDLKVPEGEVGEQLRDMFSKGNEVVVSVCRAMGEEQIMSVKESNK